MSDKFDIYQAVTDRIIKQLEEGTVPWHKPWNGIDEGAFNRVSKKHYSLLNQMLLSHSGEYATFKQWSELGGKIKKGEKSEIVVFWKMLKFDDKDANGEPCTKTVPVLRYFNVFHISQVEGVEPLEKTDVYAHEPIEEAERLVNAYLEREGIKVEHELNSAFYAPLGDYINMPLMERFKDIEEYYGTFLHEATHSTGHKSRLNRFGEDTKLAQFGSPDYSKEELVAELSSCFLLTHLGIETDKAFKNSAAYIQSWLKVLKGDKKLIVSAAGKADKAARFILG